MGELDARVVAFDRAMEAAEELLSQTYVDEFDPEIQPDIPGIVGTVRNAFLPNIRDGQVALTVRQMAGEGTPVVPLLNHGETLSLHASAYLPTSGQYKQAAAQQGVTTGRLKRSVLVTPLSPPDTAFVDEGTGAQTVTKAHDLGNNLYVRSRPAVFLSPQMFHHSRTAIGAAVLHEFTHVYDRLSTPVGLFSTIEEARLDAVRDELRAYHVGAVVSKRAYQKSETNGVNDSVLKGQQNIEELRLMLAQVTGKAFEPVESAVDAFKAAGLIE